MASPEQAGHRKDPGGPSALQEDPCSSMTRAREQVVRLIGQMNPRVYVTKSTVTFVETASVQEEHASGILRKPKSHASATTDA